MELIHEWSLFFNDKGFQCSPRSKNYSCDCEVFYDVERHGLRLVIDSTLYLIHELDSDLSKDSVVDLYGYSGRVFIDDVIKLRMCTICDEVCIGKCSLCRFRSTKKYKKQARAKPQTE
jgi:hypothetical protein